MATTLAEATAQPAQEQQQTNGASEQKTRHSEVGHKSLLKSDDLYQYILETSVYPLEPESMKELCEVTAKQLRELGLGPALLLAVAALAGVHLASAKNGAGPVPARHDAARRAVPGPRRRRVVPARHGTHSFSCLEGTARRARRGRAGPARPGPSPSSTSVVLLVVPQSVRGRNAEEIAVLQVMFLCSAS